MGGCQVEVEDCMASWTGEMPEQALDWAVCHQLDLEGFGAQDPRRGSPLVDRCPFSESVGVKLFSESVGESSASPSSSGEPYRKRTLPESLPTRKARGRQVPRRFVQDLAWRCFQLNSVPGFEQLGGIELCEEEDVEESG